MLPPNARNSAVRPKCFPQVLADLGARTPHVPQTLAGLRAAVQIFHPHMILDDGLKCLPPITCGIQSF